MDKQKLEDAFEKITSVKLLRQNRENCRSSRPVPLEVHYAIARAIKGLRGLIVRQNLQRRYTATAQSLPLSSVPRAPA